MFGGCFQQPFISKLDMQITKDIDNNINTLERRVPSKS